MRHIGRVYIFLSIIIISCNFNSEEKVFKKNSQEFTGWWVYGDGQHIFKDEVTLQESELVFLNEDIDELVELYLAVCEMEYFPMECKMTGVLEKNVLQVAEFEITHIEGCED